MIYETIITTRNPDGTCHISPMGIQQENGFIIIAPFKPSTTLENLRKTGQAVINMTDDVLVFAGCLTGKRDWPVLPAKKNAGDFLEAALAHTEVKVDHTEDDETRPRFYCRAVHTENHKPFKGFNRAQAAVLEAAILVSRLDMLSVQKVDNEIEYLKIAIEKTAGEKERTAWNRLMTKIEKYRKKQAKEVITS